MIFGSRRDAPRRVSRWSGPARAGARDQGASLAARGPRPRPVAHAHDFLVLLYLERGEHVLRVDGRDRRLIAGDAVVIAPGAVVSHPTDPGTPGGTWGCSSPPTPSTPSSRPLSSPGVRIRCCRRSSAARAAARSTCASPRPTGRLAGRPHRPRDRAGRAARRIRRRRPGPPHAAAGAPGPPSAGRTGGAGGRAAARRGARRRRRSLSRADLAPRRRGGRRAHARTPHVGHRAADRPHRAAVDHRAADAGGPAAARRHRPDRGRDRRPGRLSRGGLLHPPVPHRARRATRGVAPGRFGERPIGEFGRRRPGRRDARRMEVVAHTDAGAFARSPARCSRPTPHATPAS